MVDEYPPQLFIHPERPSAEKFEEPSNADGPPNKPDGGMWTSSYEDGTCAWLRWVESEQWSPHPIDELEGWLLEPRDDLDLYVINSKTDLDAIMNEFSHEGLIPSMPTIDFEAIADVYDGIWLTARGQAETRFSMPGLYGWDCESTLHFSYDNFVGEPENVDLDLSF